MHKTLGYVLGWRLPDRLIGGHLHGLPRLPSTQGYVLLVGLSLF